MMAAGEPAMVGHIVLNTDPGDSELLIAKPVILHLETTGIYLALAELSTAGAECMFASGKEITEQQLSRDCLSKLGTTTADKVRWHYTQHNGAADLAGEHDELIGQWLALQDKPRLPVVLHQDVAADKGDWLLYVPQNQQWFEGHFPELPVLPGIVEIDWAIHYGRALGFAAEAFVGMPRVKFTAIIEPCAVLRLSLQKNLSSLRFSFASAAGMKSQGTIKFA
jgi:3-hydroxymyristoyl/3-hydroxydecanoyl-(acyl carrier protein) dehydratase